MSALIALRSLLLFLDVRYTARGYTILLIDFFLFLFRFLVEFNEFYRIIKSSMDSEHRYCTGYLDNVH